MDVFRTAVWVCIALAIAASAWDFATRRIPNILTVGGVFIGIALHGAVGFVDLGWSGLARGVGLALVGLGACSAFPLFSFLRGEMGGGDVKLFAAIGALCGPSLGFDVQACTFLVTLAIVLPWRLARHGAFGATLRNARTVVTNAFAKREARRPYHRVTLPPVIMAPSILAGLCLALVRRGVLS